MRALALCAVALGALTGSRGAQHGRFEPRFRVECMSAQHAQRQATDSAVQNHGVALGCPVETLEPAGGRTGHGMSSVVALNRPATRRAQAQQRAQCCYNVPPPGGSPRG